MLQPNAALLFLTRGEQGLLLAGYTRSDRRAVGNWTLLKQAALLAFMRRPVPIYNRTNLGGSGTPVKANAYLNAKLDQETAHIFITLRLDSPLGVPGELAA
jgi:hypothetical protein